MGYFLAGIGVIDSVVIFVTVTMQVVVLEQQVFAGQPGYIAVSVASNPQSIARMGKVEFLSHFQDNVLQTENSTLQEQDTLVFQQGEGEGVLKRGYKGVFTQADVVDGSIVVPGVPIVGVVSR